MMAWITLLPVVLVTVLVASMFNYGICDDTGIVLHNQRMFYQRFESKII